MKPTPYALAALVTLVGLGCEDEAGPLRSPCGDLPQWSCAARRAGPCSPMMTVEAECRDLEWTCPDGSARRRAVEPPAACRPGFSDLTPQTFGPLIPDGDRCLMLVDADVTAGLGPSGARTVVLPDPPTFGACDLGRATVEPSWVRRDGLDDDDIVDVTDVVQTPDDLFAVHRLFRRAPEMLFGVEGVGASLVTVDASGMPVPKPPAWPGHGYRTLAPSGAWLYMFDCYGAPDFLLEDCGVLRAPLADATRPDAYEWLSTTYEFEPSPNQRQVVFQAGPQHHVEYHPGLGRWLMVSAAGFGDTIFVRASPTPYGPWSPATDVHRCNLPSDDPEAFCDSIRLVPALLDPEQPMQAVLTYRVDSNAPDRELRRETRPEAYRPQMVWVELELNLDDTGVPPG